ncbi:MAG: hypothetical protein JO312_01255 [Hyphomicrobiales bacterium]|nr:hypothetical protein [Hyphomicrobiales bacterium]
MLLARQVPFLVPFLRDLTLQDFPFLTSLAASKSARDRRIWLRVASDHFVAVEPDDPQAIETFAEVMAAQLEAADPATRIEIAGKLASCARTPLRLLVKLEAMDPEVSDFVLGHAVAYSERELKEAIARGARQATAVAKRKPLSPGLANLITFHDDVDVLIALARNAFAELERAALIRLLKRARSLGEERADLRLAKALLERRPVRAEYALLFFIARPDQRVEILLAAQRLQLGRPPGFVVSTPSTTLDELEVAAVARQPERFVVTLAGALDCGPDLAQRIVDDVSGEPLAVALAALGASNEVLVRVLISNDLAAGANYQRIRALARLNNALDRNAATMIVAALRDGAVMALRHLPSADGRAPGEASRAAAARGASGRDDPPQRAAPSPRLRGEVG